MLQVLGQVATCQLDAAAVRAWDHIKCTGREMALSEKANQRHIHVTFDLFQSHKNTGAHSYSQMERYNTCKCN